MAAYGESEIEALVRQTLNRAVTPVDWSAYVALYEEPWRPSPYSRYEDRAPAYGAAWGEFGVATDTGVMEVAEERAPERSRRVMGLLRVTNDLQGRKLIAIIDGNDPGPV